MANVSLHISLFLRQLTSCLNDRFRTRHTHTHTHTHTVQQVTYCTTPLLANCYSLISHARGKFFSHFQISGAAFSSITAPLTISTSAPAPASASNFIFRLWGGSRRQRSAAKGSTPAGNRSAVKKIHFSQHSHLLSGRDPPPEAHALFPRALRLSSHRTGKHISNYRIIAISCGVRRRQPVRKGAPALILWCGK